MPKFTDTTPVPHSARQMFDLVADVERYPEFLPMCEALTRSRKARDAAAMTMLVADMTVGYKMIRETFTSQVLSETGGKRHRRFLCRGPVSLSRQSLAF